MKPVFPTKSKHSGWQWQRKHFLSEGRNHERYTLTISGYTQEPEAWVTERVELITINYTATGHMTMGQQYFHLQQTCALYMQDDTCANTSRHCNSNATFTKTKFCTCKLKVVTTVVVHSLPFGGHRNPNSAATYNRPRQRTRKFLIVTMQKPQTLPYYL